LASILSKEDLAIIADAALALAEETGDEAMLQTLNESQKQLWYFAKKFLAEMSKYEGRLIQYENTVADMKGFRKRARANGLDPSVVPQYIEAQKILDMFYIDKIGQKIYDAVFQFQNELNAVLDQNMQMVYVYDDGTKVAVYRIDIAEAIKIGYSSRGKMRGQYNFDSLIKDNQMTQLKGSGDTKNLDATYREVMYRWGVARSRNKRIILWYLNNKWSGVKVSSSGDLKEAYASFLLKQRMHLFTESMEENVRTYMTDKESGVIQVDSTSGMLEGDVLGADGIEYGVKSAGASVLGIAQFKKIANLILTNKMSKQDLQAYKQMLHDKGRTRNKLIETIQKNHHLELKDDIQLRFNIRA